MNCFVNVSLGFMDYMCNEILHIFLQNMLSILLSIHFYFFLFIYLSLTFFFFFSGGGGGKLGHFKFMQCVTRHKFHKSISNLKRQLLKTKSEQLRSMQ